MPDLELVADATVIDGSTSVNILATLATKSLSQYAMQNGIPAVEAYVTKYKHSDTVVLMFTLHLV